MKELHKKEKCQYIVSKYNCKLKANGGGICWKAKGGEKPKEKDCWVPKNQGVLKAL